MELKKQLVGKNRDETAILFTVIASFLPFYISLLSLAVISVYIFVNKARRTASTGGIANIIAYGFIALSAFTAFVYDNWLGIWVSLWLFCALTLLNFSAAVVNKDFFIRRLRMITAMSVMVSFGAFADKLMHGLEDPVYRTQGYCMNANYLAEILFLSVLAAAYLQITKSAKPFYCYAVAFIDCIAIYLTGSMFAWVSVFIGLSLLLILTRHHVLMSMMFMATASAILVLMSMPELFPRLNEAASTTSSRFEIWKICIDAIKELPYFGRGFFPYRLIAEVTEGAFVGWHSHNIILECLLSFGIVGSLMAASYFLIFFKRLGKMHEALKNSNNTISAFIFALMIAVGVHAMTDLTFMWAQTAQIGAILLGGAMGASIKMVNEKEAAENKAEI